MILNYRVYPMKSEKPSFVPFLSFYLPLHTYRYIPLHTVTYSRA